MFALVKPFLVAVIFIIFLFFVIGIISIEKPAYSCFHGKHLRFADKTTIIEMGSFRVYAYPLVADCPQADRYDPAKVYNCGYQEFCQRDSNISP